MKISEIAKLAGVSSAAVSRYLNDGSLSGEKRERIRAAIEETGYQPDAVARMMRTGQTRTVGVIVPKINSESVSSLISGVSEVLYERGYLCLLGNTDNNVKRELEYMETMKKNRLAGIILMGTVVTSRHEELFQSLGLPVVVSGQRARTVSCVYHDDFHAARDLAELMIRKGRRRLCYIGVREDDRAVGLERKRGVLAALEENGIGAGSLVYKESAFLMRDGKEKMREILKESGELPEGVLCATDTIAIGAFQAIREAGIKVPEEIAVAGIGDSETGLLLEPKLTTVRLYHRQCGMEAARMLTDTIEIRKKADGKTAERQMKLGYQLIERGTA